MARNVKLSNAGMDDLAKSGAVQREVTSLAERVAANVRAQNIRVEGLPGDVALPVEVASYITDRARSGVTIAHAAGLAVQAKHGVLTKAAAAVGLEVKSKS